MTQFYKQYKSIKPYLQRDEPPADVSILVDTRNIWKDRLTCEP
jgi:succinate dehydrogenase/fumarate reductase-like Fe-S protein